MTNPLIQNIPIPDVSGGMIEVLVWIDALPIDYSDSYQARWIVGDMAPTSIRGGEKESESVR